MTYLMTMWERGETAQGLVSLARRPPNIIKFPDGSLVCYRPIHDGDFDENGWFRPDAPGVRVMRTKSDPGLEVAL